MQRSLLAARVVQAAGRLGRPGRTSGVQRLDGGGHGGGGAGPAGRVSGVQVRVAHPREHLSSAARQRTVGAQRRRGLAELRANNRAARLQLVTSMGARGIRTVSLLRLLLLLPPPHTICLPPAAALPTCPPIIPLPRATKWSMATRELTSAITRSSHHSSFDKVAGIGGPCGPEATGRRGGRGGAAAAPRRATAATTDWFCGSCGWLDVLPSRVCVSG